MRISDWSSDVCSSDLFERAILLLEALPVRILALFDLLELVGEIFLLRVERSRHAIDRTVDADRLVADRIERKGDAGVALFGVGGVAARIEQRLDRAGVGFERLVELRSEEHTSELQSLMRIS